MNFQVIPYTPAKRAWRRGPHDRSSHPDQSAKSGSYSASLPDELRSQSMPSVPGNPHNARTNGQVICQHENRLPSGTIQRTDFTSLGEIGNGRTGCPSCRCCRVIRRSSRGTSERTARFRAQSKSPVETQPLKSSHPHRHRLPVRHPVALAACSVLLCDRGNAPRSR